MVSVFSVISVCSISQGCIKCQQIPALESFSLYVQDQAIQRHCVIWSKAFSWMLMMAVLPLIMELWTLNILIDLSLGMKIFHL